MEKFTARSFLTLLAIIVFAGCGGPPAGPSGFTPIRPDPTSTPTVLVSSGPTSTPTSVVSEQVAVKSYAHPANRFSIDYPANWQFFERPDGVVFVEPGDQAGYSVVFSDVGQTYSDEELNQYLVTFIAENFVDAGSGFSAIGQEQNAAGAIVAQFSSVDPNLGQAINEVRVWQQDTIIFVTMISAAEEQWQISQDKLQELADTLVPLDTTPIVQTPPTEQPLSWVLIGSTNSQFGFLYPSDWIILQQEEDVVTVTMGDYDVVFEASVSEWLSDKNDPASAAEKAAQTFVDTLSEEYTDVESLPPTEFPLGQVNGATIDFLFTQDGVEMAGSVITAASEDKIYKTVFTAPAALYEVALQWFNPMVKSFKMLPSDDIIFSDEQTR